MSRRIVIQGGISCYLSNLAEEVVSEMQADTRGNLRFDVALKKFVYDGLDDHYSAGCIQRAESLYGAKLRDLRVQQIEKNAKQHGLLVKSRKTESNGKIKIVMVRRTYG